MSPRSALAATVLIALLAPAAYADQQDPGMDHAQMQGMDHDRMQGSGGSRMKGMDRSAMAPGAENPYGEAERKMHEAMVGAVGKDPAETWVRKMIAHHQGAVDMANIALSLADDPEVKAKAQQTITSQGKEIEELERWLESRK